MILCMNAVQEILYYRRVYTVQPQEAVCEVNFPVSATSLFGVCRVSSEKSPEKAVFEISPFGTVQALISFRSGQA